MGIDYLTQRQKAEMSNHTYAIPIGDLHFHQQETNTWCAATCAQMVLHYLSPHTAPLDQDLLRTNIENRAHALEKDIAWFGAPDGLEATLNAFPPPPARGCFRLVACTTESEVSRLIVWSLEHHHVPAIALVYGMRHWLIVRGYTADRAPTGPNDTGYQIISFDLYDPWPPVPDRKPGHWPPPHVDGTDGCGTGNDRGIALNHISYDGWRSHAGLLNSGYMTGVPGEAISSKWKGLFLAVVDPSDDDLHADQDGHDKSEEDGSDSEKPAKEPTQPVTSGAGSQHPAGRVSYHIALNAAIEALTEIEQGMREEWKDKLAGATPGQPQHVRALQPAPTRSAPGTLPRAGMLRSDAALRHAPYYIVPFEKPGYTPLAVRVDSSTGAYLQSVAAQSDNQSVISFMSVADIVASLEGRQLDFEGTKVVFHAKEMEPDPPLGWKPCRESMSPFYPFYIITLHTRSGLHELYVRAHDGVAFTHLDDNIAGA
jgi:hypothetical protein